MPSQKLITLFEGVCLTTVILAPGACEGRPRAAGHDPLPGNPLNPLKNSQTSIFDNPSIDFEKKLGQRPAKSPPGASGGLWGRSGHRLLFLRRKKAPAGALKTRIGVFLGKKRPARVLTGHIYRFFEGQPCFFWKKTPREGAYRTHI